MDRSFHEEEEIAEADLEKFGHKEIIGFGERFGGNFVDIGIKEEHLSIERFERIMNAIEIIGGVGELVGCCGTTSKLEEY